MSYKPLWQSDRCYCVDVPASRCSCCGMLSWFRWLIVPRCLKMHGPKNKKNLFHRFTELLIQALTVVCFRTFAQIFKFQQHFRSSRHHRLVYRVYYCITIQYNFGTTAAQQRHRSACCRWLAAVQLNAKLQRD
jgi:hypothetical protein